jgi:hypothetical protein
VDFECKKLDCKFLSERAIERRMSNRIIPRILDVLMHASSKHEFYQQFYSFVIIETCLGISFILPPGGNESAFVAHYRDLLSREDISSLNLTRKLKVEAMPWNARIFFIFPFTPSTNSPYFSLDFFCTLSLSIRIASH